MDNHPLITIAIPNYNYGHYLEHCLESVLNQTYDNFEVHFRDNQSTDDSYEIALKYREKFKKRGIYFKVSDNKRNVGSDKNSKLAARDSEGAFIYTLASDDAIEPDFLTNCMKVFFRYPNVSTVITHRKEINEHGEIREIPPFYNQNCIVRGEDQAAVYMMAGIAIPGQRMTRRTSLDKVAIWGRIWNVAGDWYDNFLYAMVGDVAYIKEPLVQYRVHTGNETNESEKNLLGIFEHYQLIHSFVDISRVFGMTKPVARYKEAIEKLGSMCLRYAYKMYLNNLNEVAYRYLMLAPVFKKDIVDENVYKELLECSNLVGNELTWKLQEMQEKNSFSRAQSYDPPVGFMPLDI